MALGRRQLEQLAERAWALAQGEEAPREWTIQPTSTGAVVLYEASEREKVERELRGLSRQQKKRLLDLFYDRLAGPKSRIRELMVALVNGESMECALELAGYSILDSQTTLPDIARAGEGEVRTLQQQLQAAWAEADSGKGECVHTILRDWWRHKPLTDGYAWVVLYPEGAIFPTESNTRALMANVCFANFHLMGRCKECQRFYFKVHRRDQYCRADACKAAGNRVRQQRHYDSTKRQRRQK